MTTDKDRDVRPNRLAEQLGLTQTEATQLRKDVEFGRIMSPWRVQHEAPIDIRAGRIGEGLRREAERVLANQETKGTT